MLSYQGSEEKKAMFVQRFAEHRALDAVIQGTGYENGRGCFIGCTMQEYKHESFASQIGPDWLAHLADKIFEGLPRAEAAQFGTDLLDAIPVGVDLEPVRWRLAIERHTRQIDALEGNTEGYAQECRLAIREVIDYCKLMLTGEVGESAAESAAWSAAESAWSEAWSAARSAARSAIWQWERDTLIKLIKEAK